jgi:hypothetical protein
MIIQSANEPEAPAPGQMNMSLPRRNVTPAQAGAGIQGSCRVVLLECLSCFTQSARFRVYRFNGFQQEGIGFPGFLPCSARRGEALWRSGAGSPISEKRIPATAHRHKFPISVNCEP